MPNTLRSPAPRHRKRHAPHRWLVLVALFLLMQLVNAWIIFGVISGGFPGWVDIFGRPHDTHTVPAGKTTPVAMVVPPDNPTP